MDFRLKVFISVARNLSFTNASKELQISQPAITKHIQELEAYYGVKLFARRGSRIELTAEGELMLKHAQSITDAYSLVKSDIALGKTSFSGQMSIAICNELLPKVAGELLPAFLERFPEVEFNILSGREESVEKAVEEGATITLSNTPVAVRMGEVSALSEKLNCEVIPADATNVEDLENVFRRSMEVLGGQIDFVLHSIGMSPNVRKRRTYDDLDYGMLDKTLDVSAISFHKMIQAAKKLNAIADYGSILALSYVAAQRTFYGYNDMADAKALLESIARSFGYIYGREHHVRVNTISQSPTMTTAGAGVKGMDKLFDFANRMSPLGNASAEECADYCIVMFSDLTRKVTMQNLYHDGGFSSVGMSLRAMATYEKGLDEYKDENGNIIYG